MFEAVILAGGQGTRLKAITGELPKPMIDVNGIPFLYRLMKRLELQGCSKIIVSLGYKADLIIERITKDCPVSCEVDFAIESSPLGTGGAIKLAASKITADTFIALNGDTFCDIDYNEFIKFSADAQLTISGVFVDDVSRYGTLDLDNNNNVKSMREKGGLGAGLINSGMYVIRTEEILSFELEEFSFEKDYVQTYQGSFIAYKTDGCFIDIGIPEDYHRACEIIK